MTATPICPGRVSRRPRRPRQSAGMEGRQPPRARHPRHGRHGALLCGRARDAPLRHAHGRANAPLLLRDRRRPDRRVLRDPRHAYVRQARRRSHRPRAPVRPPLVQVVERGGAARAAGTAACGGHRGHSRRRSRHHALDLLHRPQRHRARGVVVGARGDGARRLHRQWLYSDPNPVPALAELAAGHLAEVPKTQLV